MSVQAGAWGLVFVTKGPHKGRIGYYDDDEGAKAIVYFGEMLQKLHQEFYILRTNLEEATFDHIVNRHFELQAILFESVKLDPSKEADLLQESLLVQGSFYELHIRHFFDKLANGKKIFISHSSADKSFVRRLAIDLRESGFDPWFDEWEIRVGDPITQKIESGLVEADYLVLILSKKSVDSEWVQREWRGKFWDEVKERRTLVLPVLIDDCLLPALLRDKKYADFRTEYKTGLTDLLKAMV